jgi:hypothetical protein
MAATESWISPWLDVALGKNEVDPSDGLDDVFSQSGS